MKKYESNAQQEAAEEMAAYDLVEMLIKREGVNTVLSTLRCWHVLMELQTPEPRRGRAARTRRA